MARIVFAQDIYYEQIGIMCLSAALKKAGHETFLVIGSWRKAAREITELNPDVVALSLMTYQRSWARNLTAELKRLGCEVPVLGGGVHPTLNPEDREYLGLDAVCLGEGDEAVVEAVERLGSGQGLDNVANFCGRGFFNPLRRLLDNLDDLPFLDRSLYDRFLFFKVTKVRQVMASRGCPYSCPYCHNVHVRRLYPKGTKWVRMYSPERLVEELQAVKKEYSPLIFRFQDDLFGVDKDWMYRFLDLYESRNIGVSFQVQTRADLLDENDVKRLARAGCMSVTVGLETGDRDLRNRVLGKGVSDETYLELARACRLHGMGLTTNNMFCLPGERLEQALKTLWFNAKLKPGRIDSDIFKPYAGLDLTERAIRDGLMARSDTSRLDESAYKMRRSILKQPDITKVENVHKLSVLGSRCPALIPLIERLAGLPPNPLFDSVFLATALVEYIRNDLWISPVETLFRLALNLRAVF